MELLYAAAFIAVGLFASALRGKFIINRLGGFMSTWEGVKLTFVNASSVFSLIRVGVGISLYYLKKTGHLLSHVITFYVADRFAHSFVFIILALLLLGEFSWFSVLGLFAVALGAFALVKFSHRLPDFWILKMIKDYSENLKKLFTPVSVLWLIVLSIVNFAMESLAFSALTGTSLQNSLTASVVGVATMLVSPTPGGLGLYEAAVSAHFVSLGIPSNIAIGSVLAFRLFSIWMPALLGLIVLHREL